MAEEFGEYSLLRLYRRVGAVGIHLAVDRRGPSEQRLVSRLPVDTFDNLRGGPFDETWASYAAIDQPNVARLIEYGRLDGWFYFVAEHVAGHDGRALLVRLIETQSQLPVELALYIVREAARGVDAIHRAGAVGDLDELEQIRLAHNGRVAVDLPQTEVLRAIDEPYDDSGPHRIRSHLEHFSPERARGVPLDPSSQVYALGAMLFRVITLERLFGDASPLEVLRKVLNEPAPAPSSFRELAPVVESMILRSLSKDPDDRYQTPLALAHDIDDYLDDDEETLQAELAAFLERTFDEPAN